MDLLGLLTCCYFGGGAVQFFCVLPKTSKRDGKPVASEEEQIRVQPYNSGRPGNGTGPHIAPHKIIDMSVVTFSSGPTAEGFNHTRSGGKLTIGLTLFILTDSIRGVGLGNLGRVKSTNRFTLPFWIVQTCTNGRSKLLPVAVHRKVRVAEHCDLVGLFTWTSAQESSRTEWVTRITAANDLHAHNVAVELGERSWILSIHDDVS